MCNAGYNEKPGQVNKMTDQSPFVFHDLGLDRAHGGPGSPLSEFPSSFTTSRMLGFSTLGWLNKARLPGSGSILLAASALILWTGCASPVSRVKKPNEFTPRDSPAVSDHAVIMARVFSAPSGAPNTQHPGIDLHV